MRQQDADEEQTKPNRTNFLLLKKKSKKTKAWNHLNESESEMHCYLLFIWYTMPRHIPIKPNQTTALPLLLHLPTQKRITKGSSYQQL